MKRILAIVFTLTLIMSITACSTKNDDETAATSTQATTATLTDNSSVAPTDPTATANSALTDITLEEWMGINKELIDEYCKATSEEIISTYEGIDPNFSFELEINAQGNKLIVTSRICCDIEEEFEEYIKVFEDTNHQIHLMSIEEQTEVLKLLPEQYGFADMPVPEGCTSIVLDKDGNTTVEFTYPCEPFVQTCENVEEWFEDNEDLVKEIEENSSYERGNYDVNISLSAENNIIYYNATMSGEPTEDDLRFEIASAEETEDYWDSLTDEEKAEGIANIAYSFNYTMPTPDKIITTIYKEDGTKVTEFTLSK